MCLWHSGVAGALKSNQCCGGRARRQAAPVVEMELSEVLLQPLPIFAWLGLEDDASLADVANAYRKLTRVHHPDRGGDPLMWEVTRSCFSLLNSNAGPSEAEERLSAYVIGRNHDEFARSDRQGLSMRQRVERMREASQAEQERRERMKAHKGHAAKKGGGTLDGHNLFAYGKGETAASDSRRQVRKATKLALEDMDAAIGRMPKVAVRVMSVSRSSANLEIEWVRKAGHHSFLVEYQKTVGPYPPSEWLVIHRGGGTRCPHTVKDTDPEYVSEHWYRVLCRADGWTSGWSEPVSIVLDLQDGGGVTGSGVAGGGGGVAGGVASGDALRAEQQKAERLRRHLQRTEESLGDASRGELEVGVGYARLVSTLEALGRMMRTSAVAAASASPSPSALQRTVLARMMRRPGGGGGGAKGGAGGGGGGGAGGGGGGGGGSGKGWEERLVAAAGLDPRTCSLRDVVSWVQRRGHEAAAQHALASAKADWRARVVKLIGESQSTSAAATKGLAALDEMVGELTYFVRRRAAGGAMGGSGGSGGGNSGGSNSGGGGGSGVGGDADSGGGGEACVALDAEAQRQLEATLTNLTRQKREELHARRAKLVHEEEAAEARSAQRAREQAKQVRARDPPAGKPAP